MVSSNKSKKLVLLASIIILFSTTLAASGVGNDQWEVPIDNGDLTGGYTGEYISFTLGEEEGDSFKIEDYVVNIGDEGFHIFEEIKIEYESWPKDIGMDTDEQMIRFEHNNFHLKMNDSEEGMLEFSNNFTKGHILELSITLGHDVSLTEGLTLEIRDRFNINFNLYGDVDFKIERDSEELPEYTFELREEGKVRSSIEEIIEKVPPRKPEDRPLPPITIGKEGIKDRPSQEIGLTVAEREIKRGEIELKLSGEFEGSRIVRISIDRNMIGRNISDFDDIVVEVDGEELDHFEHWQDIYSTEEPGYYVNMSRGETEVFVRMNFSEHNVRIYERSVEDELSPYSFLGILIGALVVIAGAGLLFKKNS